MNGTAELSRTQGRGGRRRSRKRRERTTQREGRLRFEPFSSPDFWALYHRLPADIRRRADAACALLRESTQKLRFDQALVEIHRVSSGSYSTACVGGSTALLTDDDSDRGGCWRNRSPTRCGPQPFRQGLAGRPHGRLARPRRAWPQYVVGIGNRICRARSCGNGTPGSMATTKGGVGPLPSISPIGHPPAAARRLLTRPV